jgi:hypothetical protein
MLKGLCRALNRREWSESAVDTEIFQRRVAGFLANSAAGHRPCVEVADAVYRLRRKSKTSGLFFGRLDLDSHAFSNPSHRQHSVLEYRCFLQESQVESVGRLYLAEPTGWSVVSDIDDTIKYTHVTSRRAMLRATFLKPFMTIAGMESVYQDWASQGALFHYVSSSPWQLYGELDAFLRHAGYPAGSIHLRWFRLRDEMFKRWRLLRRKSKGGVIASMIKRMPDRRFVLVGDSGERDPEIYAKLAQRYRSVDQILIRDLEEHPMDFSRLRKIHRKIGSRSLILFREPEEIRHAVSLSLR